MLRVIAIAAVTGLGIEAFTAGVDRVSDFKQRPVNFAIENASLKIKTSGDIAIAEMEMTVRNDGKADSEVVTYLPLEKGWNVCGFSMNHGDQKLATELVSKDGGERDYDTLRNNHYDPGICDVFDGWCRVRVFPILPGARATFSVLYLIPAEISGSVRRVKFDLGIDTSRNLNSVAEKFSVQFEGVTDGKLSGFVSEVSAFKVSYDSSRKHVSARKEFRKYAMVKMFDFVYTATGEKEENNTTVIEAAARIRLNFESNGWLADMRLVSRACGQIADSADPGDKSNLASAYGIMTSEHCFYSGELPVNAPASNEQTGDELARSITVGISK